MEKNIKIQEVSNIQSLNTENLFPVFTNPFSKFQCREKNLIFENEELIGRGSYGNVYKAYYKKGVGSNDAPFALKHIRVNNYYKEGFPITALREIKILKHIKHKNVANLIEIIQQKKPNDDKGPGNEQIK